MGDEGVPHSYKLRAPGRYPATSSLFCRHLPVYNCLYINTVSKNLADWHFISSNKLFVLLMFEVIQTAKHSLLHKGRSVKKLLLCYIFECEWLRAFIGNRAILAHNYTFLEVYHYLVEAGATWDGEASVASSGIEILATGEV